MFSVYCFNEKGRYSSPTIHEEPEQAIKKAMSHKDDFPRVIITDSDDCYVFEVINGNVVFSVQVD